jgi:hypothetical protein
MEKLASTIDVLIAPKDSRTFELCCSIGEEKTKLYAVEVYWHTVHQTHGLLFLSLHISISSQETGHKPVYAASEVAADTTGPVPADYDVFLSYANVALQRALGERLARWGTEYIDPMNMTEPVDRNGASLGVRVYEAFACQFGIVRPNRGDNPKVGLSVDLRAKIVRTMSVLDHLVGQGQDPNKYNPSFQEQERNRRKWIGETVISMHDKKCYSVTDLLYDHSAASLVVEGLGMNHDEYFSKRKNITLKYPNARPMIAVLGRRNNTIHLPAELVAGNELENRVKQQLPMIASHRPEQRNQAIDKIRSYLVPGGKVSKGVGSLLPALGIQLSDGRLVAKAQVLPLPMMMAAGIQVPASRGENWAPMLNTANFKIEPRKANTFRVVVFYNEKIHGAIKIYSKIRDLVNSYNAIYRFGEKPTEFISTGKFWGMNFSVVIVFVLTLIFVLFSPPLCQVTGSGTGVPSKNVFHNRPLIQKMSLF